MNRNRTVVSLLCGVALLVSGCAQLPFGGGAVKGSDHPRAVVEKDSAAAVMLKEGIAFYTNGNFNDAIKKLTAPEMANGTKAEQLEALKYSAFSYCVTSRATLCRQQFDKAFKLDPAFDLEPGEHGHPLWGPVFMKAKKGTKG